MKDTGTLIISLDFELYWGIFDKTDIKDRTKYFDKTIKVIPEILNLFNQFQIHATWATVGFLGYQNINELKQNMPDSLPKYNNPKLSAYNYIVNKYDNLYNKYHFAPEIIKLISKTPGQEIASHTLSHFYCLEKGQNIENFEADIKENFKIIMDKFHVKLSSLVFPRNQYNKNYKESLIKNGIRCIRTNPDVWFWDTTKKETLLTKIFRTADAYLPIHNSLFDVQQVSGKLIKIPASRFFRPPGKYQILNKMRLKRIKNEMTEAAKQNKMYHLWWHPHNFGSKPEQSLSELEEVLHHFNKLKQTYNFKSLNMHEVFIKIAN